MWNLPTPQQLNQLPKLYETEHIPLQDKVVQMHFFLGSCDWYIVEYDGEDLFWGFAILNDDLQMSEWGYFSFQELKRVLICFVEVDRDIYWKPRVALEIERIPLEKYSA
ncbi:MAG: DUF2958 domain-containing protein [Caldisericia bacterium]|nr:DUF2958 domain-containing protein [Caldisericia bacterium]